MTSVRITSIVVDDEPESIKRLTRLLDMFPEVEVVTTCCSARDAIKQILQFKPDVVFLDIEMPVYSGFDIISEIEDCHFSTNYIITTGYGHYTMKAIKKQAFDYLIKPIDVDELRETLARLKTKIDSTADKFENSVLYFIQEAQLSDREAEVFRLIIKGFSSKEISEKLFISKNTVDTHRRKILSKFNVRNSSELIYKMGSHVL